LKRHNKFRNLDVTGLDKLGENNDFGLCYNEVNRVHNLCVSGVSLKTIIQVLNKITSDGMDLNHYINSFGCNLLFFVSDTKVLKALLDYGCNPNHRSNGFDKLCVDNSTPGTTALHYASFYFLWPAIQILSEMMDDKNLLDSDECSAMGYAEHVYNEHLLDKKNGFSKLKDGCFENMEFILSEMKEAGFVAIY